LFSVNELAPWLILFGLGAFHGINPAMGWLFAVALGLQEQKRQAVLRALPPIALGHALSVGVIIAIVLAARITLSHTTLKVTAAALLFVFGSYRLFRSRHPNWAGMRVGFRDLTLWSFVMASAHGAGLMLIPLFLTPVKAQTSASPNRIGPGMNIEPLCTTGFASFSTPAMLASSVGIHTLGHLLVAGVLALLVYEKLGVGVLRRAWFNLDLVWMIALVATGLFILLT
jgi:hypothetical protein